ncbi:MAG: hypothetical protein K0R93_2045 [Anaerosolibacter sp.]|jgi:hypothetical protein|nr:hypothetical protein [Anaerosolibacter sp.]
MSSFLDLLFDALSSLLISWDKMNTKIKFIISILCLGTFSAIVLLFKN